MLGYKLIKVRYHFNAFVKKIFLKVLYGRNIYIGHNVTWRSNVHFCIEGGKIIIHSDCFLNHNCSLASLDKIEIGEGSILGENVKIYDHNHRFSHKDVKIKSQGYTRAPVYIGKHCWIGSNVTILKGVTIGDNCVIAAGIVVNEDIPDNTMVRMNYKYMYMPLEGDISDAYNT